MSAQDFVSTSLAFDSSKACGIVEHWSYTPNLTRRIVQVVGLTWVRLLRVHLFSEPGYVPRNLYLKFS